MVDRVRAHEETILPAARQARASFSDWDSESLVNGRQLLLAHCRDGLIRLLGVRPPPRGAGLEWWRRVADEADSKIARFSRHEELAKLILFTGDDRAVCYFLALRLALAGIEQERRQRLDASKVGHALRRLFSESSDEASSLGELLGALAPPRKPFRIGTERTSHAVQAFFDFCERQGEKARFKNVARYRRVALGLVSTVRPVAVPAWESAAGDLLIQDITAARRDLLPLLSENLDEEAPRAVRDAARETNRQKRAKQRGGPGVGWTCGCSVLQMWKTPGCVTCGQERPVSEWATHVPVEDVDLTTSFGDDPETRAYVAVFLDRMMKGKHGQAKVRRAFLKHARGEAESASDAARSEGIDESTLREFIQGPVRTAWRRYLR